MDTERQGKPFSSFNCLKIQKISSGISALAVVQHVCDISIYIHIIPNHCVIFLLSKNWETNANICSLLIAKKTGPNGQSTIPSTLTLDWHRNSSEQMSLSPSIYHATASPQLTAVSSVSSPSTVPSAFGSSESVENSSLFLPSTSAQQLPKSILKLQPMSLQSHSSVRSRSRSREDVDPMSPPISPVIKRGRSRKSETMEKSKEEMHHSICRELAKAAKKENDAMVYLEGPRIYTCGECRTHLTSHDEIISKSFHGRHGKYFDSLPWLFCLLVLIKESNVGRAYLFDYCVNIDIGPPEDRRLITGLHSVNDIFCKRCQTLIGWTYSRAYEPSQKYKEGKFIIEKIHLHMEESANYHVRKPAGEREDKWKLRSMSFGSSSISSRSQKQEDSISIYEYNPRARSRTSSSLTSNNSVQYSKFDLGEKP